MHQIEGKVLPDFQYVDLQGQVFNARNTAGKLVVLKFWFIGCRPCITEMPALNQLVERYKSRNDVVFLSLANDGAEELTQFLNETRFDYAVIPDKTQYTMDTLGIRTFPTHMLVKDGVVEKIVRNVEELEKILVEKLE